MGIGGEEGAHVGEGADGEKHHLMGMRLDGGFHKLDRPVLGKLGLMGQGRHHLVLMHRHLQLFSHQGHGKPWIHGHLPPHVAAHGIRKLRPL